PETAHVQDVQIPRAGDEIILLDQSGKIDDVEAVIAVDQVVAGAAGDIVVAVPAIDLIIAGVAVQDVGAIAAVDIVVAAAALYRVFAVAAVIDRHLDYPSLFDDKAQRTPAFPVRTGLNEKVMMLVRQLAIQCSSA